MMTKKYKQQNSSPDIISTIVVGIFKIIWWLVKLPFVGLKKGRRISADDLAYLVSQRQEIEKLSNSENVIELKHAVMEADKLVDYKLKLYNYAGETFADRLRSAEKSMSKMLYNSIWEGHKVRNQIAHENNLAVGNFELKRAAQNLLSFIKSA